MFSRRLFVACVLPALGAGLLLFQNCQRPVQRLDDRGDDDNDPIVTTMPVPNPVDEAKTFKSPAEAAAAPFVESKVQIGKVGGEDARRVARKTGRVILPAGERLIVVLDNECTERRGGALSRRAMNPAQRLELKTQTYVLVLEQPTALEELEAAAEADECVIGISHDDVIRATGAPTNDPGASSQENLNSIGARDVFAFFNDATFGARSEVLVSVIDSGINHAHEDLKNMLWKHPGSAVEPAALGSHGYNFTAENYFVYDEFGHGTFVAGIIAAQANNGVGIAGVMGHDVKIMAQKVQEPDGSALISDITRAIDYSRSKAADVINISMEGSTANAALQSAMNAAVTEGRVIVVAAGNSGQLISASNIVVPAYYCAGLNGAISVGSVDTYSGKRSSFSNFSSSIVEIAAPGSIGVYSTDVDGTYSTNKGTSFSAPIVSGAAALVIGFFRKNGISFTPALVESTIMDAAIADQSLIGEFAGGRTISLKALARYLQRKYLAPVDGGFDDQ